MARAPFPSRPTRTDDLVRRLRSNDTDPKETNALRGLAKGMIKIFQDERRPSHVPEAAALAPVTTASSYRDLSRAFGNAVILGTVDGSLLDPQLLPAFTSVLRCAGGDKTADLELGRVMKSLQTRLKAAVEQADPRSQYRLICTLSFVLDALIDTKTAGLSREELHEPLLKQLGMLSRKRELRLAQAARYAYQALLGIPNTRVRVAKVAGAVPTMDPAKLFDGLTQLGGLPALVRSMVDVVKALSGLADTFRGAAEGVKLLQKQKSWYVALRFTDMLIQARAFNYLEEFVGNVPCHHEKEFLCGLYAQLERAWEAGDSSAKQQIIQLLEQNLVPAGYKSAHPRVHEWVKLVAVTLGRPDWRDNVLPAPKSWWPWKKGYTVSIPCREPSDGALSADLLNKAWECCLEAQVFYADVKLRERYMENDERLLKVERLSGDRLPMEQCYINLAVVEQADHNLGRSEQGDAERKSSPFSLPARLKPLKGFPREILQAVAGRLEDKDVQVRRAAADALARRAALPREILQAVAGRLEDKDWQVRQAAAHALGRQAALAPEILQAVQAVAGRLEDKDGQVRRAAADVLRGQAALPYEILQAIAGRLEHKDEDVRRAAAYALRGQAALPREILQAVAGRLEHKDENVRRAAAYALGRQAALPREILQAVAGWFEHKDRDVRLAAVDALRGQAALPREILQAVAGRLEDEDRQVQQAAVHALEGQAALPPEILIRYAESFYKVWLRRSFDEYFSFYIGDEIYIHTSGGFKAIHSNQVDRFQEAIQGVRKKLRIPWP
ncbi:armadillo-type protein [Parachaetomium inaequale]|uniref:Armadillo-type protein n=1 Tax=Parachaetomium inaequale TaxID=2588326 RepID=A0AAN6SS99_9PEZI|nr:armadillo-type protein [Parachaetomium inaequale]